MRLRPLLPDDWESVREIFLEGIASGHATFETEAPEWSKWNRAHVPTCRIVAEVNESIVGWAALSRVSARTVYRGVGEVSVYVAERARGMGVGEELLRKLIEESEYSEFWTLQASVFPENAASIAVHERCGFRIVGRRNRIGCLNGVWRDSLLLERRSSFIGV
jgi:L-amino acid N-acyltransferase YncA